MTNYSFADLLHIFFGLHQYPVPKEAGKKMRKTQKDIAREVGVSPRTMSSWFNGSSVPLVDQDIVNLSEALALNAEQADMLAYSVNSKWVRYGTPLSKLENMELLRYREIRIPYELNSTKLPPTVRQIETEWVPYFVDTFRNNNKRWGTGIKNDGTGEIERRIEQGRYVLSLRNIFHENVFMGGDSHCFAPYTYYVSVRAKLVQAETAEEGYALIFEELSDGYHCIFRIREAQKQASVVQTLNGGHQGFDIYVNRESAPSILPGSVNKIAILAIHEDHWFYINDSLIAHQVISRLPSSRLDIGVIASRNQHVICQFQNFFVYIPPG